MVYLIAIGSVARMKLIEEKFKTHGLFFLKILLNCCD